MIKDRKFLTGMTLGLVMGAFVMVLQPTNAAGEDAKLVGIVAGMGKVMVQMVGHQTAANAELKEIKAELKSINAISKQQLDANRLNMGGK